MEYVYAALLLHKLGQEVNEANLTNVVSSTGVEVDEGKIKLLVASLKDVNIDEELEKAVSVSTTPAAATEAPKEEPKKKKEETSAAAEGLSSLFG